MAAIKQIKIDGQTLDIRDTSKSAVSVSATGTATDEVNYITVDGVEKKLAGGSSSSGPIKAGTGTNSAVLNNIEDANTAYGISSVAEGLSSTKVSTTIPDLSTATNDQIITAWTNLSDDNKFSLAKGEDAHVEGKNNLALGNHAHTEGYKNIASASSTHVEGRDNKASGSYSHAGGVETIASGSMSFAHGNKVKAAGKTSFAVGVNNDSSITSNTGDYSTSIGINVVASGTKSIAMGNDSTASDTMSLVIGRGLQTDGSYQTVMGKYNANSSNGLFVVGMGEDDGNRSNAVVVDKSGNATVAGKITIGAAPANNMDVTTKQYVDTQVGTKSTVSVSSTGTVTDEISYITVDGVEKKIAGGLSTGTAAGNALVYNGTEWAQVDGYGYSTTESGTVDITWDGTITGKTAPDGIHYFMTSSVPTTIEGLTGKKLKITEYGEEAEFTIGDDTVLTDISGSTGKMWSLRPDGWGDLFVFIVFETYTYDGHEYAPGIYFAREYDYETEIDYYASGLSFEGRVTTVNKINSKWIPSDTTKQDTLVSGTNIKTVNSTSILGSGNIAVQPTLVSGTNIKTVNSTSILGSGDITVQPTLVSGTNIKTFNNESILGSGNITVSGLPTGTAAGNALVYNGSEWAQQDGYGYRSMSSIGEETITWNGDTTGKTSPGGNYWLLSTYIADVDSLVGRDYQLMYLGSTTTATITNSSLKDRSGGTGKMWAITYGIQDCIYIVYETYTRSGYTYTPGIYSYKYGNTYITEFTFDAIESSIHQIDSKWIPSDTTKQDTLVSGTNIKTINNESILGSGNITISGGLPTGTAAGNALIYDGSSWTQQDGYGYTTSGSATIEWNGDITGKSTVNLLGYVDLYKISDNYIASISAIPSVTYIHTYREDSESDPEDTTYTRDAENFITFTDLLESVEGELISGDGEKLFGIFSMGISTKIVLWSQIAQTVTFTYNDETYSLTFQPGLYVNHYADEETGEYEYLKKVSYAGTAVVHQIASKYIPDPTVTQIANKVQGSTLLAADVNAAGTKVDVHFDLTGASAGKVPMVNSAGTGMEWGTAGGGSATATTVTISVSDWSGGTTCTKSVSGVTASNIIICDSSNSSVQCTAQGAGTLTFTATTTPTATVTVKVVILS